MSDSDLTDEQRVLASAYVDGDVTPAERARVEDDADVLAEVERLQAIRTTLSDTPPPSISTRERHLAAALGAWDRLSDAERRGDHSGGLAIAADDPAAAAAAATVTAPTALADRRRTTTQRSGWLLTAAAVLVVVAGGAVITRGVLSGDTDDVASTAESAAEPAAEPAAELASDAAPVTDPPAAGRADEPAADTDAESAEEASPVEPEAPADAGQLPQAESAYTESGRPDSDFRIESPEELTRFAQDVLAAASVLDTDAAERAAEPAADTAESTAETQAATTQDFTCSLVDQIIGEAEYGTGLFVDNVVLGIRDDRVIAYRLATCEVVETAPLDP